LRRFLILAAALVPLLLAADAGQARPSLVRGLELRVIWVPIPLQADRQVRWVFRVTNRASAQRNLWFPSSQVANVSLGRRGEAHYCWSWGTGVLPVLTSHRLGPGETWTFVLSDVLEIEPGRYSLKAWLTTGVRAPVIDFRRWVNVAP
jgi:Intracellular proteinase inhibitor